MQRAFQNSFFLSADTEEKSFSVEKRYHVFSSKSAALTGLCVYLFGALILTFVFLIGNGIL